LKKGHGMILDRLNALEAQRVDLDKLLGDMEALRQETLRLYRERGGDPAELQRRR